MLFFDDATTWKVERQSMATFWDRALILDLGHNFHVILAEESIKLFKIIVNYKIRDLKFLWELRDGL